MPSRCAPSRSVVSKTWYAMGGSFRTNKKTPRGCGRSARSAGDAGALGANNEGEVRHAAYSATRGRHLETSAHMSGCRTLVAMQTLDNDSAELWIGAPARALYDLVADIT